MRDRRIRLDSVDDLVAPHGDGVDRAMNRRDDSDRQSVLVTERAADRRHGLAYGDRSRLAEGNGVEPMRIWLEAKQTDAGVESTEKVA